MSDRWNHLVALAATQHGVFSRRQSTALGIDHHRLRRRVNRSELEPICTGVLRIGGSARTWQQQAMALCLAHDGAISHRSAASMRPLDGFPHRSDLLELSLRRAQRRPPAISSAVIHQVHQLDAIDVVRIDGIPVTSIARTLCDLGSVVSDDLVERALDDALRQGCSLRWITETLDRLHRPGPSGTHSLLRVLSLPDRAGVVPDSWRERMTERLLDDPRLPPLVRQHEVRGPDGRVLFRPDLAVVSLRLGLEFHSNQWHFGPRRGRGDRRRDLAAARMGWELVYLDATDHASPDAAIEAVVDVVKSRQRLFGLG